MDINLILSVIKFASIFSTGVFGAIGIVKDYKDKNNNVTRWGRIAIVGTVCSVLLAASMQGLEFKKAREVEAATAEQNRKNIEDLGIINDKATNISRTQDKMTVKLKETEQTLEMANETQAKLVLETKGIAVGVSQDLKATQVVAGNLQVALANTERGLDPIGQLNIAISLSYEYEYDSRFSEYVKRLDKYLIAKLGPDKKMNSAEIRDPEMKTDLLRTVTPRDGLRLVIEPGSPLFPNGEDPKEREAVRCLNYIGPIFLSIARDKGESNQFDSNSDILKYEMAAWNSNTQKDFFSHFPPYQQDYVKEFALASAQSEASQISLDVNFEAKRIDLRARPTVVSQIPILDMGNHAFTERIYSVMDLPKKYLKVLLSLDSNLPPMTYLRIGFNGGETRKVEFRYIDKKTFPWMTPDGRYRIHQFNKAELQLR